MLNSLLIILPSTLSSPILHSNLPLPVQVTIFTDTERRRRPSSRVFIARDRENCAGSSAEIHAISILSLGRSIEEWPNFRSRDVRPSWMRYLSITDPFASPNRVNYVLIKAITLTLSTWSGGLKKNEGRHVNELRRRN